MTERLFAVLMLFSVLMLIGRVDATATKRVKPNRYCTRLQMTHSIVTRSVSEGSSYAPRLRFGLLSKSTACSILFILADDLGWRDLGVEGGTFYESRSLERFANFAFHSAHES